MKYLALTAILTLAACAAAPPPELDTTGGITVQKSRTVIVKGTQAGGRPAIPPKLVEWSYPVTCAPGNEGGTPQERADRVMALAKTASGQVHVPIGPQYMRSSEMRRVNTAAIPQLRCKVGAFTERVVATGEAAVLQWAIANGAISEVMDKR